MSNTSSNLTNNSKTQSSKDKPLFEVYSMSDDYKPALSKFKKKDIIKRNKELYYELQREVENIRRLDSETLALIISRMLYLPIKEVIVEASNPLTISIKRMIAKMIIEVANTGNVRIFSELMNRVVGKVPDVIDYTALEKNPVYKVIMDGANFVNVTPSLVEDSTIKSSTIIEEDQLSSPTTT